MELEQIRLRGMEWSKKYVQEYYAELLFQNIQLRLTSKYSVFILSDELKTIKEKCLSCSEEKIIITHGTDTMEITARFLGELNIKKTIVLTGAMVPYQFGSSDGLFNLGSALAFVQTLPYGVYVAMNGKYFNWNNVRKNKQSGIFEVIQ